MDAVEFTMEPSKRRSVTDDRFYSAGLRLGDHLGIPIDSDSRDSAFSQHFQKNAGPAAEVEDAAAAGKRFGVRMMPIAKFRILIGGAVKD
jgi:hypothetical protein